MPLHVKASAQQPHQQSYSGKCQYKTGKCFNERTLKRNGDAHSLCEEHRVKQNMIQRRSDRKYQTVHAIRRRERSLRRAVLKKQVSMAVAQQLFYEHQQQKVLATPLRSPHHPTHVHATDGNNCTTATPRPAAAHVSQVPPIRVPQPSLASLMDDGKDGASSPLVLSFEPQHANCRGNGFKAVNKTLASVAATACSANSGKDESTPTGIDNYMPSSFVHLPMPFGVHTMPALSDDELDDISLRDNFGYMPIVSRSGDKETWSDDDIEFLQTLLLA
ncbi:unnamed protein product [Hyaloperonospora brassicae]|uniref:BZIP domain-containing protein n=1 Tax=Hyaloperonospora brassicae TaxID=162125 RepID=A0AAV0TWN2_HYABA|nr:unnamed protein product [Hyaloperonospora brassicae]